MTINTRYPHLLSPGRIGSLSVSNRIFVTAMGVSLSEPDGHVGERMIALGEVGLDRGQAKAGRTTGHDGNLVGQLHDDFLLKRIENCDWLVEAGA